MQKLPQEVSDLINHYFNLKINGKKVKTPYHINVKHVRAELRALVGKGSPEEIEEEVAIFAKLRGFDLEKANKKEIMEFMQKEGIGVDCSGLVSHILNVWLQSQNMGHLKKNLHFPKMPFTKNIIVSIRPIENICAELLTNNDNSKKIDIGDVQVGDLIRLKGIKQGHHIAIVTKVIDNEITYTHSTKHYGEDNGIREGKIVVVDKNAKLEKQDWQEKDHDGVCWTLKQYLKEKEDNGFRRPNFFVKQK